MTTPTLQNTLERHLGYLAQDKHNTNLLLTIYDCYSQLGDWESAQRYHSAAKAILSHLLTEEESPQHRFNLAWCLYLNQEWDDALSTLNATETWLDNLTLLKIKILHQLEQLGEAIQLLEQLLPQYSADANVMGLLALLYLDNQNETLAESTADRALTLDPAQMNARLVKTVINTMRNEATVEEIATLLDHNPQESRLWFALGVTHLRQMNCPAAEHALLQVTQLWPNFYDNWISLGWCFLLQNKLDEAEHAYQYATTLNTEDADGFGGLACVAALRQQATIATLWLEKAEALDPQCFGASIAKMILANPVNPDEAVNQFNLIFPEIAGEMNRLMNTYH